MRDAEVEIAEEVLIDEIEPEPAVYVVLGGFCNYPVMVGKVQACRMALGWVGEADEDVPGRGNGQEDDGAGDGMELAEAVECGFEAASEEEMEKDDADGEDDADEALGEDVEGAGGGEEVAVEFVAV